MHNALKACAQRVPEIMSSGGDPGRSQFSTPVRFRHEREWPHHRRTNPICQPSHSKKLTVPSPMLVTYSGKKSSFAWSKTVPNFVFHLKLGTFRNDFDPCRAETEQQQIGLQSVARWTQVNGFRSPTSFFIARTLDYIKPSKNIRGFPPPRLFNPLQINLFREWLPGDTLVVTVKNTNWTAAVILNANKMDPKIRFCRFTYWSL